MKALAGALAGMAVLVAGCGGDRHIEPRTPHAPPHAVWVFPGISGGAMSTAWAVQGFVDAGVTGDIQVFDWQRPLTLGLANLTDEPGNRERAAVTAAEVAAFAAAHDYAIIDFVGYSGGGGMAVFAAEALPEEVTVRNIVLVQPALSPGYDLVPALRHVTGRMTLFYSTEDKFILGAGTETFGTMDRRKVASAGQVGFDEEAAVSDPSLKHKLTQVAWSREMVEAGHWGSHVASLGYEWNKEYVAPLLLAE